MKQAERKNPLEASPSGSQSSSRTIDTATLSTATESSGTVIGQSLNKPQQQAAQFTQGDTAQIYCRRIPTAKKALLLPADKALLPQQSYWKRAMAQIPFLSWFSGDMIGSQVPRQDNGEFDYAKASMYWVIIYWLDWLCFGIFEVITPSKEE
jgi:hypothetical protein